MPSRCQLELQSVEGTTGLNDRLPVEHVETPGGSSRSSAGSPQDSKPTRDPSGHSKVRHGLASKVRCCINYLRSHGKLPRLSNLKKCINPQFLWVRSLGTASLDASGRLRLRISLSLQPGLPVCQGSTGGGSRPGPLTWPSSAMGYWSEIPVPHHMGLSTAQSMGAGFPSEPVKENAEAHKQVGARVFL